MSSLASVAPSAQRSAGRVAPEGRSRTLAGRLVVASSVALVVATGIGTFAWALAAPRPAAPKAAGAGSSGPGLSTVPLPRSYIAPGKRLFEQSCATCHGTNAEGSAFAPNLVGLGAGTIDLWVSTGLMPLANPTAQPIQKPPVFTRRQTEEIAAYVASLSPTNGPGILHVNLHGASLSEGMSLFVLNCAACHTITGSGDALASGAFALSLHKVDATQIAEAIRTGPGNMPRFGPGNISNRQVADIVAYVRGPIQHPDNRGGIGLGGIGPVAEGFVALLIGVGGLMTVAFWLGDRA
jgi:ubiquinol-cytochrome c reductase cytochrome c subunit